MSFETLNTEAKIPLKLYGFMEYFPVEKGFVTPVFSDGLDLYIQTVSSDSCISNFEVFRDPDDRVTHLSDVELFKTVGDLCVFGFKRPEGVHFEKPEILSKFLENAIGDCRDNHYLCNNIKSFIGKYSQAQLPVGSIFPDARELWDFCLNFIANNISKESSALFRNQVEILSLNNNILRICFDNLMLKGAFERNYHEHILVQLRAVYGPGYGLETALTTVGDTGYFYKKDLDCFKTLGDFPGIQGSFKMNTCIRSYNYFDKFIPTHSNRKVYDTLLSFLAGDELVRNIVVVGATGMGKTHIAGAAYNYLLEGNKVDVAAFRASPKAISFEGIRLRAVNEFYTLAGQAQTIVIDDAHLLNDPLPFTGNYWTAINQLRKDGKRFLLTYHDAHLADHHLGDLVANDFATVRFGRFDKTDKLQILQGRVHTDRFNLLKNYLFKLAAKSSTNIETLLQKAMYLQLSDNLLRNVFSLVYDTGLPGQRLSFEKEHTRALLRTAISGHLNNYYKIMPQITPYGETVLADEITVFMCELLIRHQGKRIKDVHNIVNCSIDDSYIYWQQQFFDNVQFRDLIIDIFKDLNYGLK